MCTYLIRSAGTGRWAATVAAAAYQASPFLLAHTFEGHYPHVWAACWYPWAFWAYTEMRSARPRGLLLMPIVLALTYLTGHPQEWFLLLLALSVWSLSDALAAWRAQGPRRAVIKLLVWAGVAAFSIGLAAVEVVPQLAVRPWLLRSHDSLPAVEIPRRYHLQALNAFPVAQPGRPGWSIQLFRRRQLLGNPVLDRARAAGPGRDRGRASPRPQARARLACARGRSRSGSPADVILLSLRSSIPWCPE